MATGSFLGNEWEEGFHAAEDTVCQRRQPPSFTVDPCAPACVSPGPTHCLVLGEQRAPSPVPPTRLGVRNSAEGSVETSKELGW